MITSRMLPISATIEIIGDCNFRCVHCYQKHSSSKLSYKNVRYILNELYELGCFKVIITGGEIFLDRELLFQTLEYANYRRFKTSVITNLSLCHYSDLDRASLLQLDAMRVSMYGFSDATYQRVSKVNIKFEEMQDKILYAKHIGIPIKIQMLVTKANKSDITAISIWCHEHQIPIEFSYVILAYEGRCKENLICSLDQCTIGKAIKQYNKDYHQYLASIKNRTEPKFCKAGRQTICITSDGTVFPCETWRLPIGNISDGIKKLWRSPGEELQKIRKYTPSDFPCSQCPSFAICSFCPGANFLANGDPKLPAKEICSFTEVLYSLHRG